MSPRTTTIKYNPSTGRTTRSTRPITVNKPLAQSRSELVSRYSAARNINSKTTPYGGYKSRADQLRALNEAIEESKKQNKAKFDNIQGHMRRFYDLTPERRYNYLVGQDENRKIADSLGFDTASQENAFYSYMNRTDQNLYSLGQSQVDASNAINEQIRIREEQRAFDVSNVKEKEKSIYDSLGLAHDNILNMGEKTRALEQQDYESFLDGFNPLKDPLGAIKTAVIITVVVIAGILVYKVIRKVAGRNTSIQYFRSPIQ